MPSSTNFPTLSPPTINYRGHPQLTHRRHPQLDWGSITLGLCAAPHFVKTKDIRCAHLDTRSGSGMTWGRAAIPNYPRRRHQLSTPSSPTVLRRHPQLDWGSIYLELYATPHFVKTKSIRSAHLDPRSGSGMTWC
jgi:hypothetical protein